MWRLAQDLPDPRLLQGNGQEILVWIVLAQIALYLATVTYFLMSQKAQEKKYDDLQTIVLKIVYRSNRAMEAVANLPAPEES